MSERKGHQQRFHRKRKRPKYTAEQPLLLDVIHRHREAVQPTPRQVRRSKRMVSFVTSLPYVRNTASGRRALAIAKISGGLVALWLVARGKEHIAWGIIGVLVALAAVIFPVAEVRRLRWLQRAKRIASPAPREVRAPAVMTWDGRKLSVSAQGRVVRSLRPTSPVRQIVFGLAPDGTTPVIGLLHPKGRSKDHWWFAGPTDAAPAPPGPLDPELAAPIDPLEVDLATWSKLHELFVEFPLVAPQSSTS